MTTASFNEKTIRLVDNKYYISADSTYADDRVQVLNYCDTFGIFNRWGDILPFGKEVQGLYYRDTRYISTLEMKLNGVRPKLLSSTIKEENEVHSVDLTNPELLLENGELLHQGTVHIRRSQSVKENSFFESLEINNYNSARHNLLLSLNFDGDFKDIFEIRGLPRKKRGTVFECKTQQNKHLSLSYKGLDDMLRRAEIRFSCAFNKLSEDGKTVTFDLMLLPKQKLVVIYSILFESGEQKQSRQKLSAFEKPTVPNWEKAKSYFLTIETSNEQFTHWINRSKTDLTSLMADTEQGKYPYAGVPWYNTAFGRDGIITALETLWAAPNLAKDVLLFLAENQSDKYDEAADAEPGKILHEIRGGEMVVLNEVPFKKYYGTIDATPLFVVLAGEYFERTADYETIRKIWPNIVAALKWIEEYGDIDKDGFVEYQHKAKNGLTNQGWKDSYDSVFYSNGELAEPPIALCEVQGYVYSAKMHASKLAKILGHSGLSESLKDDAEQLKIKFNKSFWDPKLNTYVLALDGEKKPCKVKSSNAGQILFTGIAQPEKAEKLVKTLLLPDMFSGWGIRTLSSNEARYNPMSYHNGSVWPHDVALIAEGFSKYGYRKEALQLMTALFDASLFINLQRLPELFCGLERRKGEGPTAYPVACSPQAWSVAAVFMLLKSILQIKISPVKKEVSFHKPILPQYLESVRIKDLSLGDSLVDLEILRHGNDDMVGVNWKNPPENWKLVTII